MAYNPATKLPTLAYFQWETPSNPNPRLASPVQATDTTLTFTSPPLDHTGSVISIHFLMGIENTDGYVETVYVPAGALSGDGLTATGVVRGIRLEGIDYTTSDSTLASDFNQDSPVFCNVSAVNFLMMIDAQQGLIASGGTRWRIGDLTNVDINVTAANGDVNEPFFQYNAASNQWVFSNDGVSSTPFGTGAGVVAGSGISISAGTISVNRSDTSAFVLNSSGAGDSGKAVILNASGKFNTGFIPSGTDSSKVPLADYTAKGDGLFATAAATPAAVSVGPNNSVLIADSAQSAGVKWGAVPLAQGNYKNGTFSRANNTASGTQIVTHNLGVSPVKIKITGLFVELTASGALTQSFGTWNGSTTDNAVWSLLDPQNGHHDSGVNAFTIYMNMKSAGGASGQLQTATVSAVSSTTFTLNWTLTGTLAGATMFFLWEVEG